MVLDLYKHLFKFNFKKSVDMVADDVVFIIYGHGSYVGQDGLNDMINDMKTDIPKVVSVTNALSHGKYVFTNGEIIMNDDSKMAFAEVFEFSGNGKGAKVAQVDSYVVAINWE